MHNNETNNIPKDIMRVFLALCSECDRFDMTDVIKLVEPDEKISAVNCNSCRNSNTVLMTTISVPETYEKKTDENNENIQDG